MTMIENGISAEAAFDGHPDRIADQIVASGVDEILRQTEGDAHIALKCSIKGVIHVMGELKLPPGVTVDLVDITRRTIRDIGYTKEEFGFSDKTPIIIDVSDQSANIDEGVNGHQEKGPDQKKIIGAGDQGHMFGGAVRGEAPNFMPWPIFLSHELARKVVGLRKELDWLRPDGKCQVVVRYADGKAAGIDHITIAASHDPLVDQQHVREELYTRAVLPLLDPYDFGIDPETQLAVNGAKHFVIFGPKGDAGEDCRKIIDDTYGGYFSHGGGGFHGKDATKVDVTGLVGARKAALAAVASGLADKMQIQIAYVIGHPYPVAINIETFGTAHFSPEEIYTHIMRLSDYSVGSLIEQMGLNNPIYRPCAWGGLFGRTPEDDLFPWERIQSI